MALIGIEGFTQHAQLREHYRWHAWQKRVSQVVDFRVEDFVFIYPVVKSQKDEYWAGKMFEEDKYSRPHCPNCNLILGVQSFGSLANCPQCGKPLTLKSFNPWPKVVAGIAIIGAGAITLLIKQMPIIWIGGFLWGGIMIYRALQQWSEIKQLDRGISKEEELIKKAPHLAENPDFETITCGNCGEKIPVKKGKGITTIKCPNCLGEYRVKT